MRHRPVGQVKSTYGPVTDCGAIIAGVSKVVKSVAAVTLICVVGLALSAGSQVPIQPDPFWQTSEVDV